VAGAAGEGADVAEAADARGGAGGRAVRRQAHGDRVGRGVGRIVERVDAAVALDAATDALVVGEDEGVVRLAAGQVLDAGEGEAAARGRQAAGVGRRDAPRHGAGVRRQVERVEGLGGVAAAVDAPGDA